MTFIPLIITVQMDLESQEFYNELREKYFPKEKNFLKAHITLYHKLPGAEVTNIKAQLNLIASYFPLKATADSMMFLGNGVAYKLACPELEQMKLGLDAVFKDYLIPQDRQKYRPHITIQNKVPPEVAKKLFQELSDRFVPREIDLIGFGLWEYLGGPWRAISLNNNEN